MSTPALSNLLRKIEGLSLTPYLCPAGYPTQGYGRRVKSLDVPRITVDIAEQWLKEDIATHEAIARSLCPNLSGIRLDALTDLVYNVGKDQLDGPDNKSLTDDDAGVVRALRAEDWPLAAKEMRRWVYSKGKILNGLVRRRAITAGWIERGTP